MCAVALAVLTFAAMQVFRDELGTEGKMSILGGFIGSWFFVFVLTATGNFFSLLFGQSYQTKLFPEGTTIPSNSCTIFHKESISSQ